MLDKGLISLPLWMIQTPDGSRNTLDNQPARPKQKWELTPDAFDALLSWLDTNRERAGERYEVIRSALIRGFQRHGCTMPEELADETINRVARKVLSIATTYVGDPAHYFYAVAHHVHMEYLRRPRLDPLPETELALSETAQPADEDEETVYECLKVCMETLTMRKKEMILQYYQGERQVKIRLRKELAERLGIKLPLLRLQAQRVRVELKKCIQNCLEHKALA